MSKIQAELKRAKTKDELLEVLRDIAGYMLPVYTFNDQKYVPLLNAKFLRTQARLALGLHEEE